MIFIIIGLVIIGTILAVKPEPCPRELLSYKCRGDKCDHSDKAWYDAHIARASKRSKVTDITVKRVK